MVSENMKIQGARRIYLEAASKFDAASMAKNQADQSVSDARDAQKVALDRLLSFIKDNFGGETAFHENLRNRLAQADGVITSEERLELFDEEYFRHLPNPPILANYRTLVELQKSYQSAAHQHALAAQLRAQSEVDGVLGEAESEFEAMSQLWSGVYAEVRNAEAPASQVPGRYEMPPESSGFAKAWQKFRNFFTQPGWKSANFATDEELGVLHHNAHLPTEVAEVKSQVEASRASREASREQRLHENQTAREILLTEHLEEREALEEVTENALQEISERPPERPPVPGSVSAVSAQETRDARGEEFYLAKALPDDENRGFGEKASPHRKALEARRARSESRGQDEFHSLPMAEQDRLPAEVLKAYKVSDALADYTSDPESAPPRRIDPEVREVDATNPTIQRKRTALLQRKENFELQLQQLEGEAARTRHLSDKRILESCKSIDAQLQNAAFNLRIQARRLKFEMAEVGLHLEPESPQGSISTDLSGRAPFSPLTYDVRIVLASNAARVRRVEALEAQKPQKMKERRAEFEAREAQRSSRSPLAVSHFGDSTDTPFVSPSKVFEGTPAKDSHAETPPPLPTQSTPAHLPHGG